MLFDGGVGAMSKVLEAYMGEAAYPTLGQMTRPLWALVQRGA